MQITNDQLKQIYIFSTETNRLRYLPFINRYANIFGVNTYERLCAFLAQVGHESAQLRYNEELASGKAYEGRKDLGNVFAGDGVRFKGRGLIQITGRANYTSLSKDLGVDFVEDPLLLKDPEFAVMSAFWFWDKRGLNRYATLREADFRVMTRIINGGYNGYSDRVYLWNRAKRILE